MARHFRALHWADVAIVCAVALKEHRATAFGAPDFVLLVKCRLLVIDVEVFSRVRNKIDGIDEATQIVVLLRRKGGDAYFGF